MGIHSTDQLLSHLERNSRDELKMLASTGAELYPTGQLLRLLGQWEVYNQLFNLFQGWLLRIAAVSPGWLLLWGLFKWIDWPWMALTALALFPLSFFVFFAGLLFMRRFFHGRGHLEQVGEMIQGELQKRKSRKQDQL